MKRYIISGRIPKSAQKFCIFLYNRRKNDSGAEKKNIFVWSYIGIYESDLVPRRRVENTIKHIWF